MKKKIYDVINFVFLSMMLVSCDRCETETILGIGSGGNFTVVNMGTSDTLKISGGITIGPPDTLVAHNGNVIKIRFEQKEEYKKYSFKTEYTLPNDSVVTNEPEHKYVVGDTLNGPYDIYLGAQSLGESHGDIWNITASGTFILKVE